MTVEVVCRVLEFLSDGLLPIHLFVHHRKPSIFKCLQLSENYTATLGWTFPQAQFRQLWKSMTRQLSRKIFRAVRAEMTASKLGDFSWDRMLRHKKYESHPR